MMKKEKLAQLILIDLIASLFLGVSIVVFAVQADFAPGGVSGVAVLLNYLFDWPIGMMTVAINVPIILLTVRRLGLSFFLCSVKTMLVNALFIDYVVCHLPVFTGSRLAAAVLSGVFAGVAYSMFFNAGTSTGGTDFIIAAVQRAKPQMSFGLLALIIDGTVIVLSVFVFRELMSFVYGMVYTVVTSLSLDATTWVIKRIAKPQAGDAL